MREEERKKERREREERRDTDSRANLRAPDRIISLLIERNFLINDRSAPGQIEFAVYRRGKTSTTIDVAPVRADVCVTARSASLRFAAES